MGAKVDLERLLKEGKAVQTPIQGYSMYPMLVPGRDEAVIAPLEGRPRRGDVVLYRRDGGILVLHRIWKVKKDGLYMVGDNQTQVEGPLREDQLRGRLVAFVRKGRTHSVRSILYRIWSSAWLRLRPIRHRLAVALHSLKMAAKGREG